MLDSSRRRLPPKPGPTAHLFARKGAAGLHGSHGSGRIKLSDCIKEESVLRLGDFRPRMMFLTLKTMF
jgi:hypothetical protein